MLPNKDLDINDGIEFDFEFEEQPSKTFKIDFNTNRIVGIIDGLEAVKQAVFLICKVERYKYLIYDWNYGVEIDELIGENIYYVVPELKRRFTEALLQDDRVLRVDNFRVSANRGSVYMVFDVHSIYGEFEQEVEV